MSGLDHLPAWIWNQYGAFCPSCGEHIADGSEDYDWGCGCCGFPNPQDVADWHAGFDHDFPSEGGEHGG